MDVLKINDDDDDDDDGLVIKKTCCFNLISMFIISTSTWPRNFYGVKIF